MPVDPSIKDSVPDLTVIITHRTKMFTRSAVVAVCQPPPTVGGGGTLHLRVKGKAMGDSADIRQMSDPDFLAERARVRETIAALKERMAELDDEFVKRAGAAWAEAAR